MFLQALLLNPIAETKNPFIVNVVGWYVPRHPFTPATSYAVPHPPCYVTPSVGRSMRYMNYTPDMAPKK